MKKVLLVGVIGFLLIGCGKEKVTKEMLVGDWRCKISEYERSKSGDSEDYGVPKKQSERIISFKIIGNDIYQIDLKGNENKLNFDSITKHSLQREIDDSIITINQETVFKDQDNYIVTTKTNVKDKNNKTNIIDLRQKTETTCTRVK